MRVRKKPTTSRTQAGYDRAGLQLELNAARELLRKQLLLLATWVLYAACFFALLRFFRNWVFLLAYLLIGLLALGLIWSGTPGVLRMVWFGPLGMLFGAISAGLRIHRLKADIKSWEGLEPIMRIAKKSANTGPAAARPGPGGAWRDSNARDQ